MRSQNTDRSLVSRHHNYRHVTRDERHVVDHTWTRILSHNSTGRVGVGKCKTMFTRRHYPEIMKHIEIEYGRNLIPIELTLEDYQH